jgi:hypothetical protein
MACRVAVGKQPVLLTSNVRNQEDLDFVDCVTTTVVGSVTTTTAGTVTTTGRAPVADTKVAVIRQPTLVASL